jgi:hypothetical protein
VLVLAGGGGIVVPVTSKIKDCCIHSQTAGMGVFQLLINSQKL